MTKTTPIKQSIHHKKDKGAERPWEHEAEHHISANEISGKMRLHKHFPSHKWPVRMEKRKGSKV